ncbi:hypothetical protein BLOT_014770 [Blomia tropicalis]|nr:hypothetical protein BLOT_014770 [Blomia tropicalis]
MPILLSPEYTRVPGCLTSVSYGDHPRVKHISTPTDLYARSVIRCNNIKIKRPNNGDGDVAPRLIKT